MRVGAATKAAGSRSGRAQVIADLVRQETDVRWVGIYTVTETSVENEAWSGPGPPAHPTFPRTRGLTAHAVRVRAVAVSNDVANDPRYLANQADSGSEVIVPALHDGRVVGTLDIESDEVGAFTGEEIACYERIAVSLAALWAE